MNILNQPINPGGQPVFPAADARQPMPASVRFDGLTQPSTAAIGRCQSPRWQAQTLRRASNYIGIEHDDVTVEQTPAFQPLALNFLQSLLNKEKMSSFTDGMAGEGRDDVPSQTQQLCALRVVVSSAVELDARQTELIARKMQRITGLVNLTLEIVIDPSLIAGFLICYGQDESHTIDLSVKGQLAALKNRVDSFEQSAFS